MAYGIIENGIVINAVEASAAFAAEQGWAKLTGSAGIGWTYVGGTFTAPAAPSTPEPGVAYIPVPLFRQRLEKLGLFDDFSAYLIAYPKLMLKVLTLESGIDPAYPDLLQAFADMQIPPPVRDYLLADPSAGVPDVQFDHASDD